MATRNFTRNSKHQTLALQLNELLSRLTDLHDTVHAIEAETVRLIDREALARFARLEIRDIGQKLETTLFERDMLSADKVEGDFADLEALRLERIKCNPQKSCRVIKLPGGPSQ